MQDQALSEGIDVRGEAPGAGARELTGHVVFASEGERDAACVQLERAGMVVAELEGIGPSRRGRLAEAIDEALESKLVARGAAPPGITSGSDRDATLSDQLFRARRAGATGLAVVLGPLRAITGELAALEPEDCATLRFLATATRERPVALVLDVRDSATGAYGDPVALSQVLTPFAPAVTPAHAIAHVETPAIAQTPSYAEPR